MTHKNDGFIENLMKVPAPLKPFPFPLFSFAIKYPKIIVFPSCIKVTIIKKIACLYL